ncbi:XcbB/CpsF family capsular polysaccharide biosynthesis protein [Isoptericola sp. b515]|nr:XcbB/CpsF family capsular polysaccharide biosynthesis protein [Isoptericola sp. b515]MDO8149356.1 XcbB/CpsF family capsular polysaccharide biosynthesis protein [Isoptericola sp. b515]
MKHRVFIYGSCVSRDTFEYFDDEQFELAEYVARQSAISAYTKPVELIAPPTLESRFQQRMLSGDFGSSLPTLLRDSTDEIDLFLVDLVDERLGAYVLPDGSVITRSLELISSGAENLLPAGSHHLPFGSDIHLQYWSQGLETVASLLRTHHPRAGVALLDIPWASVSETGTATPPSFGVSADEANALYRPYIDAAARILDAEVVTPGSTAVVSSPDHAWGDAPFHYAPSVYRSVASVFGAPRAAESAPPAPAPASAATPSAASAATAPAQQVAAQKPSSVMTFDASTVTDVPEISEHVKVVTVKHGSLANGEENLVRIAYKNHAARHLVYQLAAQGFHMYRADKNETRFVLDSHIPDFWHKVKDGDLQHGDEGLIHTVEPPRSQVRAESMVVVFSSMATPYDKPSILRYMDSNYRSLPKHVPDSTAILRIADVDGVVGGFYLDTHRNPDRTAQVTRLVERVAGELGVPADRIITYGPSKGGTAALYYAARNGWRAVSVDPVLDDTFYESTYDDLHWTAGPLFVHRKRDLFHHLGGQVAPHPGGAHLTVITSPNSPQYPYTAEILQSYPPAALQVVRTNHPEVTEHAHVSPRTLSIAASMMTLYAIGAQVSPGVRDVDRPAG